MKRLISRGSARPIMHFSRSAHIIPFQLATRANIKLVGFTLPRATQSNSQTSRLLHDGHDWIDTSRP